MPSGFENMFIVHSYLHLLCVSEEFFLSMVQLNMNNFYTDLFDP